VAPPWKTCEAVLSEAFHLLGARGRPGLATLLRRGAVVSVFDLADELDRVLSFMQKYADIPMSLADACLVRMSETLADPLILTTDAGFRIYRRHPTRCSRLDTILRLSWHSHRGLRRAP
jgi:hypothetical protein